MHCKRIKIACIACIGLALASSPCTIQTFQCFNRPDLVGKQFSDEDHVQTEHMCYRRAGSFDSWCQNPPNDSITVTATFTTTGMTQFYSPSACDPGWILFDASCYLYNLEYLNWSSANSFCASRRATLASIHSDLENDFLHSLTGGLSVWIGFRDVKKDVNAVEDYRWTDNSQVDYRNWNTSHPPDTDKGKEWHEWDNRDPAPCICKMASTNKEVGILRSRIVTPSVVSILIPDEITVAEPTPSMICWDVAMSLLKTVINFGSLYAVLHPLTVLRLDTKLY